MANNIKKRETTSEFELENGRKFVINAYDPLLGNYLLLQLATFILPLGLSDAISENVGSESAIPKAPNMKPMTKQEFIEFQRDILSTIEERMESGHLAPVMRDNGTFGVEALSMSDVFKLIVASVAFNFKDFFAESPLDIPLFS